MTDIEKIKAALEPFAIDIKDHVPDDHVIETVAWTAGQHRAACEALELLSAHASRVAELEKAIMAVVNATRLYLPPDGIDAKDCISMILEATDNPAINPIILDIETKAGKVEGDV